MSLIGQGVAAPNVRHLMEVIHRARLHGQAEGHAAGSAGIPLEHIGSLVGRPLQGAPEGLPQTAAPGPSASGIDALAANPPAAAPPIQPSASGIDSGNYPNPSGGIHGFGPHGPIHFPPHPAAVAARQAMFGYA